MTGAWEWNKVDTSHIITVVMSVFFSAECLSEILKLFKLLKYCNIFS